MSEDHFLTRRQLVRAAGGLAAAGTGALAATELLGGKAPERRLTGTTAGRTRPVRRFSSRPDLNPPAVAVTGETTSAGHVLLTPCRNSGAVKYSQAGCLILAGDGEPVWFKPVARDKLATNLRTATYDGKPVLTWWEGNVVPMGDTYFGQGEGVIVDTSYRELARVRAAGGRHLDLHEFVLTPQGTALFTCTPRFVSADLRSIGGHRHAHVIESIVQEVDVRTGRLLLEWRSLDHVHPSESYLLPARYYDYFHANSIDVTADGNLLVSARGTWTVYKLERRTGSVMWRLGGKRTDFDMDTGSQFAWQHHAVRVSDHRLTVFDNGTDGPQRIEPNSRALVLDVDLSGRSVQLGRVYTHPQNLLAQAEGSVQALPNGNVFVGWGFAQRASEFAADGKLVEDIELLPTGVNSYRAFRSRWHGQPHERPTVTVSRDPESGEPTLYASWNGATEVRYWRVQAGAYARDLRSIGVARREGFETGIPLGGITGHLAVTALDAAGNALATSRVLKI